MKKFLVLFIASFITGMFCCFLVGITTKAESSSFDNIEFCYKGQINEKLWFKSKSDSLYESDSTVYSYDEGIISTPKCVAEVAFMLLDELHFGYMKKNEYPLKVVKDVKSWKVYGNSYESPVYIQLYRKTGMVMDY
ncbi:hypothetical protein KTQ96_14605 [Prevotella copri]|uniref:hypothetical protein n=1 Tax=Segatella copri TaxID=165179 RepID=UPI001C2BBC67|nr:hypothetical protein [Segatella copri]MBU9909149.1 hypothetical protein [Segatella copri]MBV3374626.1 hypothetical protein [Segatella copri]